MTEILNSYKEHGAVYYKTLTCNFVSLFTCNISPEREGGEPAKLTELGPKSWPIPSTLITPAPFTFPHLFLLPLEKKTNK